MKKTKRMCQAEDNQAKRCRGLDTKLVKYYGENEIYSSVNEPEPEYVVVYLCSKHRLRETRNFMLRFEKNMRS